MLQRQPSFKYKIDSFYTIQQKNKKVYTFDTMETWSRTATLPPKVT